MLLRVDGISKFFAVTAGGFNRQSRLVRAVDGVNFSVSAHSTLGIVGESGSGKTTLAKLLLRLLAPSAGTITYDNAAVKNFRKDVQIVFQNPFNSLNPKLSVYATIAEPLIIHALCDSRERKRRVAHVLDTVGLPAECMKRYPRELSGGQRQRVCIARALASEPKLLILDEPLTSLDLTIQSRLLDLFIELKNRLDLTYVFISHNLCLIRAIADTVLVMKDGRIVEQGLVSAVFERPAHPYTQKLLASARE